MRKIKELEQAREQKNWDGINTTVSRAYYILEYTENEHLDFESIIWEREVKDIVETLRKYEIKKFTISEGSSRSQDLLAEFINCGAKLTGMTKVKTDTYEKRIANAFLLEL